MATEIPTAVTVSITADRVRMPAGPYLTYDAARDLVQERVRLVFSCIHGKVRIVGYDDAGNPLLDDRDITAIRCDAIGAADELHMLGRIAGVDSSTVWARAQRTALGDALIVGWAP